MPTLADIFRACYAFWRLLMFDQRAIYLYPPTGAALWRSFSAYPLSILLVVLGHWLSSGAYYSESGFTFVSYALFMTCQQIIGISGFYLVMHNLTARFKNRMLLPHYIIMQNWVSIPVAGVYLLTDLLVYMVRTSPDQDFSAWYMLASVTSLLASWSITQSTLRLRQMVSFGVCLLEGLFMLLVSISMLLVVVASKVNP